MSLKPQSRVYSYQFIQETGYVPYDTCLSYMACSQESTDGFCKHVDTTCSAANTCRTCDTFAGMGGACTEIDYFPNATVAEYGMTPNDPDAIMAEIFARGPVAATVNAEPIVEYAGGVFDDDSNSKQTNHIVRYFCDNCLIMGSASHFFLYTGQYCWMGP